MPISFTDKYDLNKEAFLNMGAFDVILDIDSRLFVDPALLDLCDIPEFVDAKAKVKDYFSDIVTLMSHAQNKKDMYWREADKLLTFKELTGTCFGYSQFGTDGNSIGTVLRNEILQTMKELIDTGEKDPILFELLGVFQEGIGCDRISDLLTFILANDIYSFTQRITDTFSLSETEIVYNGKRYNVTINPYNKKPVMLLPTILLSPLPAADNFDDIGIICMENERVRREINAYFNLGRRKKLSKPEIYWLMKTNPSFRNALINAYKSTLPAPYDFKKDSAGEYVVAADTYCPAIDIICCPHYDEAGVQ